MDFHTAVVLILSNWKEVFSPMVEKEHLIDLVGISKEFDFDMEFGQQEEMEIGG